MQPNRENSNKWDFLKFLIAAMGNHYDYSPRAPENLATPQITSAVKTVGFKLHQIKCGHYCEVHGNKSARLVLQCP